MPAAVLERQSVMDLAGDALDEAAPAASAARPSRARQPVDRLRPPEGGLYTMTVIDEALNGLDDDLAPARGAGDDDHDEGARRQVGEGEKGSRAPSPSNPRARALSPIPSRALSPTPGAAPNESARARRTQTNAQPSPFAPPPTILHRYFDLYARARARRAQSIAFS